MAEREILMELKQKSMFDHNHTLEAELEAIQVLKKELEAGIRRSNGLQQELEESKSREQSFRKESGETSRDESLEISRGLTNGDMSRRLSDQSSGSEAAGGSDSRRSSESTPPGQGEYSQNSYSWPIAHQKKPQLLKTWSPSTSSDSDIPLNRQSLSEWSAPMLRKFIRQMKHSFERAEKENIELRRKVDDTTRQVPGRNENDVSKLPVMHLEIQRLNKEVTSKNEEIRKLKSRIGFAVDSMDIKDLPNLTDLQNENLKLKVQLGNLEELNMLLKKQITLNTQSASSEGFNPELIIEMANEIRNLKTQLDNVNVRYEKASVSCQTGPWSDAVVSHVQTENRIQKKASKIPQMQKTAPMKSNSSDRDSPDFLKSQLSEAQSRMLALEAKLEATEGTVRLQSKKMKYYRNLLEEHGLTTKSPMGSRSNSESNIAAALSGRILNRSSRTLSYDNIPELLVDSTSDSDKSDKYRMFGHTDNVVELKEQVRQLKIVMDKYKTVVKSQVGQKDTSVGGMSTQTHHDMDDTFIPRQSVRDLQCKLSASEENNLYLKQKISSLEKSLSDLKTEARKHQDILDKDNMNTSQQSSPTKRMLDSQKLEIVFLRKKLADTQNSCVQLEGWLNELNDFLNELMYVDEDDRHGNMRGLKQKVDQSRLIIQSMSSTLLEQDCTDASFSVAEESSMFSGNESMRKNIQSLTEELCRKNREVEKLTDELKRKNANIGQLNHDLLSSQNKVIQLQESAQEENSSSNGIINNQHRVSPIRSPTSTTTESRRFSDMSHLNHSDKSTERLRHATGTSDGSHAPFMQSVDDVNFTSGTMDSSMRSSRHGDHVSRSFSKGHHNGYTDFTCTSTILGSEERLMDNRHDYYDATHTPTYLQDASNVSFPSLHFDNTHCENENSRRVTFSENTRSESPVNNVSILTTRLNALEDLNRTLKDEVSLYEKMCTSMGTQISPRKSPSKSSGDLDKDLLLEHLQEIRALRTKLERSLEDSDRLREALERDLKKDNVETGLKSDVYLYSQHQSVVRELQLTIQKLEQDISDKEDLINSVRLRAERESKNKNNQKTEELERTIEKLRHTIIEREDSMRELKHALNEREITIKELTDSLNDRDDTVDVLKNNVLKLENANDVLKNTVSRHESEIKQMFKCNKEKEEFINELKSKVSRAENVIDEKVSIIKERDEKIKSLSQMRKKLELQEQSLHQQEQKLKEQYEIIKQQDEHIKKHVTTIRMREEKITQIETVMHQKQEKIEHLEHSITSVEKERNSLERSCHKQDVSHHQQEENLRRREENIKHREEQLRQAEEQRKSDGDKLKKQDLNLRKAAKEIRRLNTELKTLQEQAQENKDLNQTLKLELSVYEKLQKQEGDYDTKGGFDIRDLLTEIRHLRVQLERCIETNSALRQKLEEHLLHQTSPRSHPGNVKSQSPARSGTTTGTDATDGQPSPEKPRLQLPLENSQSSQLSSIASRSQNSSISEDQNAAHSLDIHTWPGASSDRKHELSTHSLRSGTLHSVLQDKRSEGNISYYVDDPPSKLADFTFQHTTVDSDIRNLFSVGKLDDYEKLKKENYESLIVLNGMEARIQERLRVFKSAPVSESIEYSTLKELSMSVQNLKICLNEEKSLITCFWTTTLPKGDTSGQKMMAENEALRNELYATRTKYELMSKLVHDAEERLHASNRQKQNMEDIIYKQLKRTTKVMAKARTNFEKVPQIQQNKENIKTQIDVDEIESFSDTFS